MTAENRFQAGGIDETHLAQQRRRVEDGGYTSIRFQRFLLRAVAQDADVVGRRGDANRHQVAATHQRIDDAGFARAERAEENDQERVIGVQEGVAQLLARPGREFIQPWQKLQQRCDHCALTAAHRIVCRNQPVRVLRHTVASAHRDHFNHNADGLTRQC